MKKDQCLATFVDGEFLSIACYRELEDKYERLEQERDEAIATLAANSLDAGVAQDSNLSHDAKPTEQLLQISRCAAGLCGNRRRAGDGWCE